MEKLLMTIRNKYNYNKEIRIEEIYKNNKN
jgi:hypothetical protein